MPRRRASHTAKICSFQVLVGLLLFCTPLYAKPVLDLVDWRDLTDQKAGPDGRAALAINRDSWKHAETEHFVYHFHDLKKTETVYIRAEAYYEWIKEMFGVSEDLWTAKCHVYVFEDKALWKEFNTQPGTERLPGVDAYTNGEELFIYLDPFYLEPQKALAHEIAHVVLHRFVKGKIPLALNEGFAQFMSSKAMALRTGGNEYAFRTLKMVPGEDFLPAAQLVAIARYPAKKEVFYQEGEFLARYLILNFDQKKFYELLSATSSGTSFKDALKSIYDMDLDTFEQKFKTYAMVSSQK